MADLIRAAGSSFFEHSRKMLYLAAPEDILAPLASRRTFAALLGPLFRCPAAPVPELRQAAPG